MITLVPMTEAEFAPYCDALAKAYAQEQVESGDWEPETAGQLAAESIRRSLPQGLATPDHALFRIYDDAIPEAVGQLWVRLQGGTDASAFIMDIEIDPAYQRRGYAQAALDALETYVRSLGIGKIGLRVHVQNRGAKALYEKQGFQVTGHQMLKRLSNSDQEQPHAD